MDVPGVPWRAVVVGRTGGRVVSHLENPKTTTGIWVPLVTDEERGRRGRGTKSRFG
jgi:hypothetical protein